VLRREIAGDTQLLRGNRRRGERRSKHDKSQHKEGSRVV
jgi:hypothetical protein